MATIPPICAPPEGHSISAQILLSDFPITLTLQFFRSQQSCGVAAWNRIGISRVEDFSEDLKALTLLGWMTAKEKTFMNIPAARIPWEVKQFFPQLLKNIYIETICKFAYPYVYLYYMHMKINRGIHYSKASVHHMCTDYTSHNLTGLSKTMLLLFEAWVVFHPLYYPTSKQWV